MLQCAYSINLSKSLLELVTKTRTIDDFYSSTKNEIKHLWVAISVRHELKTTALSSTFITTSSLYQPWTGHTVYLFIYLSTLVYLSWRMMEAHGHTHQCFDWLRRCFAKWKSIEINSVGNSLSTKQTVSWLIWCLCASKVRSSNAFGENCLWAWSSRSQCCLLGEYRWNPPQSLVSQTKTSKETFCTYLQRP